MRAASPMSHNVPRGLLKRVRDRMLLWRADSNESCPAREPYRLNPAGSAPRRRAEDTAFERERRAQGVQLIGPARRKLAMVLGQPAGEGVD
jgi:hypothetical protein